MTVYGYTRVSTSRQAEEGESLATQKRTLEGYAMMHGLTIDRVFVERGVSGSKPLGDRPEGAELLAVLQAGDVVITPKLDRMFRSARDALAVLDGLKSRNVSLHMIDLGGDVTGNGISKLVFTILSAVAEAERDRTRERIAEVKADQKTRLRFLGGTAPFGWDIVQDEDGARGGRLVPNKMQQEAIIDMVQLRRQGLSLRAVAQAMAAKGFDLSHFGVQRIIRAHEERLHT